MFYRAFGKTGLKVSEIGLGCSNLGGGLFGNDGRDSIRLLDRAFELGVDFFDTADSYGYGRSEELIGAAFRSRRDRVFIASKVGMLPSSLGRYAKTFMLVLRSSRALIKSWKRSFKAASRIRQDFSVAHITSAVEASLKRLRTDYMDLLQLHSPPMDVLDRNEVFDVLFRLSDQGKARFFGVSSRSIWDACQWLNYPMLSSIQVPFNLLEQEGGRDFFTKAAAKGIAVIVRVPFARGLLTSKAVVETGRGMPEDAEGTARIHLQGLSFLELEGRRSISQAALQFILSHPEVSVVIPGTGVVKHLEENVRSPDSPALTEKDLQRIFLWQAKRAPFGVFSSS